MGKTTPAGASASRSAQKLGYALRLLREFGTMPRGTTRQFSIKTVRETRLAKRITRGEGRK